MNNCGVLLLVKVLHKNRGETCMILFHASQIPNIQELKPHISNHHIPLIYFSSKRENTLVYLSNAIEKYCKETGFEHHGRWHKWATYGFTKDKILHLQEYYPNATERTYQGVSGYIYYIHIVNCMDTFTKMAEIPDAYSSRTNVMVSGMEYIPDAYEEIMQAVDNGRIVLTRYADLSAEQLQWIEKTVQTEYKQAADHPEYRYFLEKHFKIH